MMPPTGRWTVSLQGVPRLGAGLLACLALAACTGDPPEERLRDYQARLFRTLDIPAGDSATGNYPRFPAQRYLRTDPAREVIDILDLWSLRECALHSVLAERNSSLGRVARPSSRMVYELDFLRLAPACIELLLLSGKEELAATLRDASTRKAARLPAAIWQGVLGGAEYRHYWKLPQRLGDYPVASRYFSDQALVTLSSHVRRWLAGDYAVAPAAVEAALQQLGKGDGGALYKSLMLQAAYLGEIDEAVRHRLRQSPVCRSPGDSRADVLDTVVRKFFIGRIQPWSVQLQGRAYQLEPARALEQLLVDGEPQAFRVWREERDRLIAAAQQAPREHVQALLPVMRQCGLAPQVQAPP